MTREGWNPERPVVGWGRGDNEGIQENYGGGGGERRNAGLLKIR